MNAFAISPMVVERLGWVLVHSLWQLALIALAVGMLSRLIRRRSAAARYVTLSSAMFLLVVSPIVTWFCVLPVGSRLTATDIANLIPELRQPSEQGGAVLPFEEESPGGSRRAAAEVTRSLTSDDLATESLGMQFARLLGPWLSTIVGVWCGGVLLFSIRPAWSWFTVRRLQRIGTSPVAASVQHALERICTRLQVVRRVEVLTSTLVTTPVVVGCFRSVILLPASFIAGVPLSQLEAILAHELAHIRRYDYLVNFLQTLVETLFFYHPAVWWLSHQIRVERENCCDDLAVAALGNKIEYGRALLAVEEFRGAAALLALSAKGGSLRARVRRLFSEPTCDSPRGSAGLAALAVVAAGLLVAVAWSSTRADAENKASVDDQTGLPWRAHGRVIDADGRPLKGVTVRAATGVGTLLGGGSGVTDAKGRYDFRFGMGIQFGRRDDGTPSPQTQYALISTRLDGHFEENFNRHGNGIASLKAVSAEEAKSWGVQVDQVCTPDRPREVNFVMLPAARVSGTLVGEDDQPLKDFSVSLAGEKLPPGSSVLAQVRTDEKGRFEIAEIPTTVPYQFKVRKPGSELRPPWDDSWASGRLRFADTGENDMTVSIQSDRIVTSRLTVKSLRLKIVGAGIHGKEAVKRAANREFIRSLDNSRLTAANVSLDDFTFTLSNGLTSKKSDDSLPPQND